LPSTVWSAKTRMVWQPDGQQSFEDMRNRFDRISACDRQIDGRTSCDGIVRTIHSFAR